jgi:hypothetical protein
MYLSNQAKTLLVIELIQILSAIIAILISPLSIMAKAGGILIALVVMGIGAFLVVKTINCMVVGDCTIFAWIIVGIMLIFITFAVLTSVFGYAALKENGYLKPLSTNPISSVTLSATQTPKVEEPKATVVVTKATETQVVKPVSVDASAAAAPPTVSSATVAK